MPACLGLYIENNLIKYAKVNKERNMAKVEAFGIKFYDGEIKDAISQIVAETFSFKTPISVNLSDEMYHYFNMFALLNKNDMQKAIHTEFESVCFEKGYNKNVFDTRYLLTANAEDKDKIKAIHISANKTEITRRMQQLEGNQLTTITLLPIAITNLLNTKEKENCMVVNIEDKTTITTVLGDRIYHVDTLPEGTREILTKINAKENSYSRAYEACKNTTIYTTAAKDLQIDDNNEYLEEIMPTLYNIVEKVKENITTSLTKIDKVYITGTASAINNIDLYFQENLTRVKCEILKPYFLDKVATAKLNIKEYIEVNSAIALAMQGLNMGVRDINFKKEKMSSKISGILHSDVNFGKSGNASDRSSRGMGLAGLFSFRNDLGERLDSVENAMLHVAGALFILVIIYVILSVTMTHLMYQKGQEADAVVADTKQQIQLAQTDIQKLKDKTNEYTRMIQVLEEMNDAETEKNNVKDAIPILLTQVMTVIPKNVQITSIENTTGKHIKINAQSHKYEQLSYFKGKLKTQAILLNVTSDSGVKEGDIVKTTIEGDLP